MDSLLMRAVVVVTVTVDVDDVREKALSHMSISQAE